MKYANVCFWRGGSLAKLESVLTFAKFCQVLRTNFCKLGPCPRFGVLSYFTSKIEFLLFVHPKSTFLCEKRHFEPLITKNPSMGSSWACAQYKKYKKVQLSLTNPHDVKACQKLLQFDVLTTLSLTILVSLHSFICCCVQNLRNPKKFSENSNL